MGFRKNYQYLITNYQSLISSLPTGLILVWLLTFPAITPFLQPILPWSADGLLHLYRIVALDQALRQGVLFPRWLPDLAFGYGQPLFVFYGPLAYYFTETFNLLTGQPLLAMNVSFALALLLAGTGAYLYVKEVAGMKAGILAGVAYVYAPYQLINALSRGSLPVVWAGALFPFVFWAFHRLAHTGRAGHVVLSAGLLGLALLMHNISNLIFMPLLLFYLGIDTLAGYRQSENRPGPVRLTALALVLGLGLAAFFWLPAVVEKDFVQVERVITPPDFDYRAHFVQLSDLFAWPAPANTGLLNPDFSPMLGLVQVGLAVLGVGGLLWRGGVRRRRGKEVRRKEGGEKLDSPRLVVMVFSLTGLIATLFMTLPGSTWFWDRLPFIAFVQHPDRLLGAAIFLLAILAGVAVGVLPQRWQMGLVPAGISLIVISAVPLLYPRYYTSLPAPLTVSGMMDYERSIGAIGTTSFGEYLPVWVKQTPRESPLEPGYRANQQVARLDPAYLPAGTVIEPARYGFNEIELVVDAPQPFQAVFHTFYFPGWQATLDGQPAIVEPVTERGLIGIPSPAGRHTLHLFFTETPLRRLANGLSGGALLALLSILVWSHLQQPTVSSTATKPVTAEPSLKTPQVSRIMYHVSPLPVSQFLILLTLALMLILLKLLYLDKFSNPLKHVFAGNQVTGVAHPMQVNFGHQLNLLGYDLAETQVVAGESFDLTLYWQARQPLATDYSVLAQLVDAQQHLYGGQDNLHPGGLPTSRWEPWGFVRDPHRVPVPPGTPPGDYFLIAGPYQPTTWVRLAIIDRQEGGWGDVVAIPVKVQKPVQPPAVAALGITWPGPQNCQGLDICFLGATPERETIQRNDFLRVALFWEAILPPEENYRVNLQLVAEDGRVALEQINQPSHGHYPTTTWVQGERVRDNHAFWIPPDFPAGRYQLRVRWVGQNQQAPGSWQNVGELRGWFKLD